MAPVIDDPYEAFLANPPSQLGTPDPFITPAAPFAVAGASDLGWVGTVALASGFIVATKVVKDYLGERPVTSLMEGRSAAVGANEALAMQLGRALGPAIMAAYGPGLNPAAAAHLGGLAQSLAEVTTKALIEGFIAGLNDGDPVDMAWERAMTGYGLNPQQMRSFVRAAKGTGEYEGEVVSRRALSMLDQYIATRATNIAETEMFSARTMGQQARWMLLARAGDIPADSVKEWQTAEDEKVCAICAPLDKKQVPLDEPWMVGDREIWAPGVHPNCRCRAILIVTEGVEKISKAYKNGMWVEEKVKRDSDGQFSRVREARRQVTVLERPQPKPAPAAQAQVTPPVAPTQIAPPIAPGQTIAPPTEIAVPAIAPPAVTPATQITPPQTQITPPQVQIVPPQAKIQPPEAQIAAPQTQITPPQTQIQPQGKVRRVRVAIAPARTEVDTIVQTRLAGSFTGAFRLPGQVRPDGLSTEQWESLPMVKDPSQLVGMEFSADSTGLVGYNAAAFGGEAANGMFDLINAMEGTGLYRDLEQKDMEILEEYLGVAYKPDKAAMAVDAVAREIGQRPEVIAYLDEADNNDYEVGDLVIDMAKNPRKFEGTPLAGISLEVADEVDQYLAEEAMDSQMERQMGIKEAALDEGASVLPSVTYAAPTYFVVDGGMIVDNEAAPVNLDSGALLSGRYRVKGVRQVGGEDTIDQLVRTRDTQAAFDFTGDEDADPEFSGGELERIVGDLDVVRDVDQDALSGIAYEVVLEPILEDLGAARKPDQVLRRVKSKGSDAT